MHLGVIGPDGERLAIVGDGLLQIPWLFERSAKVVLRLGVIWLDGQRLELLPIRWTDRAVI
jgi:hypothetical protein